MSKPEVAIRKPLSTESNVDMKIVSTSPTRELTTTNHETYNIVVNEEIKDYMAILAGDNDVTYDAENKTITYSEGENVVTFSLEDSDFVTSSYITEEITATVEDVIDDKDGRDH